MKRTLALMALMAGLTGSLTLATAQDTKKAKTEDKKADDKKAAKADDKKSAGSIEIQEGPSGWRYRVKNNDNKTIAMATKGYEKKEDVLKELETIKKILNEEKPKEVKE